MQLSVIIVSWNTCALLQACLQSIESSQPHITYDVWVVDNASTDNTAHMIAQSFPNVHLLVNDRNLGFSRANNQALSLYDAQYALLLNSDTLVLPGALEQLVEYMDQHPQVGACGPRLLNPDHSLQLSVSPFPTLANEFTRLMHFPGSHPDGSCPMETWDQAKPRPVEVLLGAAMLVRSTALQQVGLLDEDYFFYSEEVDFCYRLHKAGWEIYWVPQATIIHYGGQSVKQTADHMFLQLYRGKITYFRKNHGPLSAAIYKIILTLASMTRILGGAFSARLRPDVAESARILSRQYKLLLFELAHL